MQSNSPTRARPSPVSVPFDLEVAPRASLRRGLRPFREGITHALRTDHPLPTASPAPGWVHRHGWRLGRRLPHSVTYFQLTAHTEQGKLAEAIQAESGGVVGTRDEGDGGWGNPRPAETAP